MSVTKAIDQVELEAIKMYSPAGYSMVNGRTMIIQVCRQRLTTGPMFPRSSAAPDDAAAGADDGKAEAAVGETAAGVVVGIRFPPRKMTSRLVYASATEATGST